MSVHVEELLVVKIWTAPDFDLVLLSMRSVDLRITSELLVARPCST